MSAPSSPQGSGSGAPPPSAPSGAALAGAPSGSCLPDGDAARTHALVWSPALPRAGEPLRALIAGERPLSSKMVISEGGSPAAEATPTGVAPVFYAVATVKAARAGATYAARVDVGGGRALCAEVSVPASPSPAPSPSPAARRAWDARTEDLYSAWVAHLFERRGSEPASWNALHEVLRDPSRNALADHFALGDDTGPSAPALEPDCADLPYFLRAYFAARLQLPFAFSSCTRGGGGRPPSCVKVRTHALLTSLPGARGRSQARSLSDFLRTTVADTVHSGAGRLPLASDEGDFYPVCLDEAALRPGAIYADPYGHLLVLTGRAEQQGEHGGQLFAVDGQPDGTIAQKRFWRGQFLWNPDPTLGGSGFKRFRPVSAQARPVAHAALSTLPGYGDLSVDQGTLDVEAFYDRMDELLSPAPRSPSSVLNDLLDALEEQARGRVKSVANALAYLKEHPEEIEMPKARSIFETVGPWEDYSTPSRDLRLLVALDAVLAFPAKVKANPARFRLEPQESGEAASERVKTELIKELARRSFEYDRSDGSRHRLTLAELATRTAALEIGWNPNDCPEVRWGAPDKTDERKTCRRRATSAQRREMEVAREWFHARKRPPR